MLSRSSVSRYVMGIPTRLSNMRKELSSNSCIVRVVSFAAATIKEFLLYLPANIRRTRSSEISPQPSSKSFAR